MDQIKWTLRLFVDKNDQILIFNATNQGKKVSGLYWVSNDVRVLHYEHSKYCQRRRIAMKLDPK